MLATGHSSRALFQELLAAGVTLTAKHFAMGFRIEHPQVTAAGAGLGLAIQFSTTCRAFDLLYVSYQVCLLSVFRSLSMSCSTVLKAPRQSSEAKVSFTFILPSAAQQALVAWHCLRDLAEPCNAAWFFELLASLAAGPIPVADYRVAATVSEVMAAGFASCMSCECSGRVNAHVLVSANFTVLFNACRGLQLSAARSASACVQVRCSMESMCARQVCRGKLPVCSKTAVNSANLPSRCAGGQVVPTSINEQELCVNGMSFA